VRLKVSDNPFSTASSIFQFLSVRLKEMRTFQVRLHSVISIPLGAIKSQSARRNDKPYRQFQFLSVRLKEVWQLIDWAISQISIPLGAIKSICILSITQQILKFQFLSVRLKAEPAFMTGGVIVFQFLSVRLKDNSSPFHLHAWLISIPLGAIKSSLPIL